MAATLLLVVVGVFVLIHSHRKEAAYQEALQFESSGERDRAYEAFEELGGYADSAERIRAMVEADPALPYRTASKGDLIDFGTYEQNDDLEDGAEPIRWIVLDKIDDRLLLLSLDCLEGRAYHRLPFETITWEKSDLRAWMNSEFLNTAFTDSQRSLIPLVEVENKNQSTTGTDGGPATSDRVFALSETEAEIYISNAIERELVGLAVPSNVASEALLVNEDGHVDWWLRSPGTYGFTAQFVDGKGVPFVSGANVDVQYGARPALWLNLSEGEGEQ